MGVDWEACDGCPETFCDCGDFAYCETCGKHLCPNCMEKYEVGHLMMSNPTETDQDACYYSCPFCAKEAVSDGDLLAYANKLLGTTKEQLIALYKEDDGTEIISV